MTFAFAPRTSAAFAGSRTMQIGSWPKPHKFFHDGSARITSQANNGNHDVPRMKEKCASSYTPLLLLRDY